MGTDEPHYQGVIIRTILFKFILDFSVDNSLKEKETEAGNYLFHTQKTEIGWIDQRRKTPRDSEPERKQKGTTGW